MTSRVDHLVGSRRIARLNPRRGTGKVIDSGGMTDRFHDRSHLSPVHSFVTLRIAGRPANGLVLARGKSRCSGLMKRRAFLGTLAAGGIGTILAQDQPAPTATQAVSGAPSPQPPLVETPTVMMAPRADGLEMVWAVSRLSLGRLEWETEDGARGVAADEFPYGQLIGGGPQLTRATWVEGIANANQLELKMSDLAGNGLHAVTLKPLLKV
jgi:hypothetical protein